MARGKVICKLLGHVRQKIAERYGIEYTPKQCNDEVSCFGTCIMRDLDMIELHKKLEDKDATDTEMKSIILGIITQEAEILYEKRQELSLENGIAPCEEDYSWEPMSLDDIKTWIKSCYIAGVQFHNINDIWDDLYVGAKLALIRDRDNEYDCNAIAVALESDYDGDPDNFDFDFIIGYIPRNVNDELAVILDKGGNLEAEISELNKKASYGKKIKINICLNNNPRKENSDVLRISRLDDWDFDKLKRGLFKNGFASLRFLALPKNEHDLPMKGEKVVVIHPDKNQSTLYLMSVLARGKGCEKYHVFDYGEYSDGAMYFIMSNIIGPIIVNNSELTFLSNLNYLSHNPDRKLPEYVSKKVMEFFRSHDNLIDKYDNIGDLVPPYRRFGTV